MTQSANTTKPSLVMKKPPAQQRAAATYERILDVTAETLVEVGIERLSTNLVCERASLSPPALYRYFPNKYALLHELGCRLMQRQNELIPLWITPELFAGTANELETALTNLILETYFVTERTVGGMWIMRSMRAVPVLHEVLLESHNQVTEIQSQLLAEAFPTIDTQQLRLICRVAVELIHATVELLFDEALDKRAAAAVAAAMISSYAQRIQSVSVDE